MQPGESTEARGVTRGEKGAQFPGRRITMGAPNGRGGRRKVPTMSHVLSSTQYISFRKISGSNMGAPNLLFAPGAIWTRYAPDWSRGLFWRRKCTKAR